MKLITIVLSIMWLIGCSSLPPQPNPEYSSVRPVVSLPLPVRNGAIYRENFEITLFEDRKARRVGDIITVILSERTAASKKASTSTKKDVDINIGTPSIYGGPVTHIGKEVLEAVASGERSFTGEGDSTQSNSLTGQIAVTVVEILANGNLFVRGEKLLTLNQGSERIQLSGIVRSDDVRPDNSVLSTQIADAQIIYTGEGELADANSMGWLAKFFSSDWWPF